MQRPARPARHARHARHALIAALACLTPAAAATDIPRGLYFHTFTGSVQGSEWSTWAPRPADQRPEFSDLSADGRYAATFDAHAFTFDNDIAHGTLADDGSQTIDWLFPDGTNFHSEVRRAPLTDERFPVFLTAAVAGNAALSADYHALVTTIDPATGETLTQATRTVRLDVAGTTARLTDADDYFQGVWTADDQAAFRVIAPQPRTPRYRTFPGSETSLAQNLVGELRLQPDGAIDVTLFLQSRAPLGQQTQSLRHYHLTPTPAPGVTSLVLPVLTLAARRRR